jgi:3-isopropylmalate/(R)-2-methylmalate dehydratase small subunit
VSVDLEQGEIHSPEGGVYTFEIAPSDRHMLLNGLDHIDYTLQCEAAIDAFAERDRAARPWAYRS